MNTADILRAADRQMQDRVYLASNYLNAPRTMFRRCIAMTGLRLSGGLCRGLAGKLMKLIQKPEIIVRR